MYNGPYNYFGYYPFHAFNYMPMSRAMRGIGIMNRFGNGFSFLKKINWHNLINGASRTLGVVNQAIPLVRQVGPLVNNMRSMARIVSLFRDETSSDANINTDNKKAQKKSSDQVSNYQYVDNNNPTFFNV